MSSRISISSSNNIGSNNNNNSPQRQQRRDARRTKRFHQRISLLSLLVLAVSPSFVTLYFTSTSHHHGHDHDHHHNSSSIISSSSTTKSSHLLRPPSPLHSQSHNHQNNGQIPPIFPTASLSRLDTRSMTQQQHQQQQLPLQSQEQKHGVIDSSTPRAVGDDDIEKSDSNGHVVCQTTTTISKQQQDEDIAIICCARWEYNTDDWWLQHYDYEIAQQENATHTCFEKITNPQRLDFLHRVDRNQWQQQSQQKRTSHYDNKTESGIDIDNDTSLAKFCAHDVQVNQISTGYAAALTSLTRSFAAALTQNRPFQYNKRHDKYHWNFSIRNNINNNTITSTANVTSNDSLPPSGTVTATNTTFLNMTNDDTVTSSTSSHWAYCPSQDMNCFYLPLGQCHPQLGRHDDGFRGKKPPSAGAVAAAATRSGNNNMDTTIQQERFEFLWLRRYAFRPRHVLRHQLYLFLQQHLTTTHQQELARILAHSENYDSDTAISQQQQQQQSLSSSKLSSSSSCTAIHVRRGDVAFGKGRRYAAVQEYLDAGNVSRGETIILLTDDVSTIKEIQEFHNNNVVDSSNNNTSQNNHEPSPSLSQQQPYYHWIYIQRPRFLGSQGGFEGFIPSNDPAFEVLAILADMHLASYCSKLVHGKSGFVDLLVEERERAGKPVQTILLDIQQDKGSQPKLDPQERAQQYLQRIRQGHAAVSSVQ